VPRSFEATLSQNGESCDWWCLFEKVRGPLHAMEVCYHYTTGPYFVILSLKIFYLNNFLLE